ncbi:MAG: phosphoenolpyruvate synthase [Parcubacteria group bacterium]|nr:phosphoenolpyruvate synthase [Parcubacteria group bacterium]
MKKGPLILWFKDMTKDSLSLAGGKGANLGELVSKGVAVPNGFTVTTELWRSFMEDGELTATIQGHLSRINFNANDGSLGQYASYIWRDIVNTEMSERLKQTINRAYLLLDREYSRDKNTDVAVRSSAVCEDSNDSSFAGQHETYLNIRGAKNVIEHIIKCFASLFTERSIAYRHERGIPLFPRDGIAVVVQKMVRSDKASAGVAFSHEPVTQAPFLVCIQGSWGLGEAVVGGEVTPDTFMVLKPPTKGARPILARKELGTKMIKCIYGYGEHGPTRMVETAKDERESFCLSDEEILSLAEQVLLLEEHYGRPIDVEWAKFGDGEKVGDGKIYIVQTRPATALRDPLIQKTTYVRNGESGETLVVGAAASPGAVAGIPQVVDSPDDLSQFVDGNILVAKKTDPDWLPAMRRAKAVVTDEGGKTSHAAIVARELGIPCIVGTRNATKVLNGSDEVTVDANQNERGEGVVYEGILALETKTTDLRPTIEAKKKTKTKVMFIMADPGSAERFFAYPNDGIGLVRLEFVMENLIRLHPSLATIGNKLNELLLSDEEKAKIAQLTAGYDTIREYVVSTLTQGLALLAGAMYPNPIIVRFSDFKTNEYRRLLGGHIFEPNEENPMLGWRGASRYYDERYREAFHLECEAIKRVRDECGFTNVKVMVPFCRTPLEAQNVLAEMSNAGLVRGENKLEVYMMVEIPTNVLQLEDFAPYFDGFSIGSNDLTQLTLGIDRDSGALAHIGDERNPSVQILMKMAIEKAGRLGKPIGICGQAPSNHPDYAAFLVGCGIDSISVMPDAVPQTIDNVLRAETELAEKAARGKTPLLMKKHEEEGVEDVKGCF